MKSSVYWTRATGVAICLSLLISCSPPAEQSISEVRSLEVFGDEKVASLAEKAVAGDRAGVAGLIATGVDVNAKSRNGEPLVLWALRQKSIGGFRMLLEYGADASREVANENKSGSDYSPKVIDYVMRLPVEYLEAVLEFGFDPDYVSQSLTNESLVFAAISQHSLEHLDALVKAGANIDWRDSAGVTPIAKAHSIGDFRLAYWLLEQGADPVVTDRWGYDIAANEKRFSRRVIDADQKPWYDKLMAELTRRGLIEGR